MTARARLMGDVGTLYDDRPDVGGRVAAAILELRDPEADLLLQLADHPALLMSALEALVQCRRGSDRPDRVRTHAPPPPSKAAAGPTTTTRRDWRSALQTHLQRRLRRTPTADELQFDVTVAEDGQHHAVARLHVAGVLEAEVATAEGTATRSAAIQDASRRLLDHLSRT